jgi:hypothetical protein
MQDAVYVKRLCYRCTVTLALPSLTHHDGVPVSARDRLVAQAQCRRLRSHFAAMNGIPISTDPKCQLASTTRGMIRRQVGHHEIHKEARIGAKANGNNSEKGNRPIPKIIPRKPVDGS